MTDFLQRLKQRKLVQWAVAYLAAAWVVLQVLDLAVGSYGWPNTVMHIAFGVLALGFVVMLVLAWYHGERGAQRVGGVELLIIALVLAVGGGLLWHFSRPASSPAVVARRARSYDAAVCRSGPCPRPAAQRQSRSPVKQGAAVAAPATSAALLAAAPIAAQPIPAKSVAVLPFENLSADKNNAYFADGMQDLILTKLADIGDLKVIARTSTMQYGSHPENLTLVGQQLGVATILEGSVQKAGNQVLINVQLIDAKTDAHIWAQDYTRTLDNIFGVEGEVADKVAKALNAKLTATETASVQHLPTTNPQAYTLYLKANYEATQFYNYTGNPDQLREAVHYLTEAIAHDPKFALAYAELSLLQTDIAANHFKGSTGLQRIALANARKAVALQPNLPKAHGVLGEALMESSPRQSLDELQTALRLGPNSPGAHTGLVVWYIYYGHWQQAATQLTQLLQLDPRSSWAHGHLARIDMALRRYTQALQTLTQGLAIDPHNNTLIALMADIAALHGQPRMARQWILRLPDQLPFKARALAVYDLLLRDNAQALHWAQRSPPSTRYDDAGARELLIARTARAAGNTKLGAAALAKARGEVTAALRKHPNVIGLHARLAIIEAWRGHRAAALRAAYKATALFATWPGARVLGVGYDDMPGPGVKAAVLAHFGDANAACAILDKLLATPGTGANISPASLRLDPTWDPIRHDPAFQALLKQYGQTEPAPSASVGSVATK